MDSLSRVGIFIEVARQESFAKAARELGLTSSAVSKQIQNLEHDLKVQLLNRTTRKVSLTEEGSMYYARASRAITDLREAAEALNELKTTPHGSLKISAPLSLGNLHLKTPIAEFAMKYPDVHLDISFDDRLINLQDEDYDIVLRVGHLSDSSLIAKRLASVPLGVFASPLYLERHGTPKTAQDLANHNVLAYTRNKRAHEWRYRDPKGKEGNVVLKGTFKGDGAQMMIEAACHGLGIVMVPVFFAIQAYDEGKLVSLLEGYSTWPERNLYAIFPSNRYQSARVRLFIDHIEAFCSKALSKQAICPNRG